VHSNTLGFRFDTTPVAAEYQNMMALRSEAIYLIKFGFVPYDEGYEAAIKKLKDASLDKVVQEYEKQFQAFLAEEKK
jgi:putative aldouronate transport system substrate-binding protein